MLVSIAFEAQRACGSPQVDTPADTRRAGDSLTWKKSLAFRCLDSLASCFVVSWFLGFLVSKVSLFQSFLVSWFQSFLVSKCISFLVSKFLGFKVSKI